MFKEKMPKCHSIHPKIPYRTMVQRSMLLQRYPNGRCLSELVSLEPDRVVFRCSLYRNSLDRIPFRVAHASMGVHDPVPDGMKLVEYAEELAVTRVLDAAGLGVTFTAMSNYGATENDPMYETTLRRSEYSDFLRVFPPDDEDDDEEEVPPKDDEEDDPPKRDRECHREREGWEVSQE